MSCEARQEKLGLDILNVATATSQNSTKETWEIDESLEGIRNLCIGKFRNTARQALLISAHPDIRTLT